jgi:nucleotide-binding universal stress UspA family protein
MTKRKGSPLVLVHVWEYSPSYLVPTEAPTVEGLLSETVGADMLVLGNFGQGHIADALLGSVSAGCIRHASCPVVVIPQGMVEREPAENTTAPS